MSLTNIALNSRSMNGQIVLSDGVATISEGNIDCEDINSANLNTDNINTNLLNVTGKLECNSAGPYNIPISISSVTGLLIGYGHVTNSGATDFLNFQSTYTSTQGGFRFWNKSSTQTLTNLAIIDNTQTYFSSPLTGCLAETPVNNNSVVNKTYVDSNFVYKTGGVTENISGNKTFVSPTFFNQNLIATTAIFCNTLNARDEGVNTPRTLFTNLTTASTITIGTNNTPITINSTNTNFTGNLLAKTNLKMNSVGFKTGNAITLTFPLEELTILAQTSGSTTTLQLPTITANELGMVFTFFKRGASPFTTTINATNQIFLSNSTSSSLTNSTLLDTTKHLTKLLVSQAGVNFIWIEVTDYSLFDREQNNLIYARLASPNAFTNTNTFNSFLPTSTLTPSLGTHLITKTFSDQTYIDFTTDQTITATNKRFARLHTTVLNISPIVGGSGNRHEIYISGTDLTFNPVFNSNSYTFYCKDAVPNLTTPLTIDSTNTTIANNLICNSQATFNTNCPISNTSPTANNHLTRKDYVDNNFVDKSTAQNNIAGAKQFLNTVTFNGGSSGGNSIVSNFGLSVGGQATFNGQANFNGSVFSNTIFVKDLSWMDIQTPFTNRIQSYLDSDALIFFPQFNLNRYAFITKDAVGNQTNAILITNASTTIGNNLVSNNITAPSSTIAGENNIYTNLIASGTIKIGNLLSTNVVEGDTTFSSDITTQNIFCNDALYLNDYQPLPSPITYSSILVQNSDILNFDANFLLNKFQFLVSSNAVLLLDATNTTIYNNLISNSQATFNNSTPICSVSSPTANNHLTRKDYVDNNFVDKTNTQTGIAGDKTFTGRLTNTFVIFAKDLSWLDVGGSGGRVQSYISGTDLGFISVNVNNNRYFFNTLDGAGNPTTPLLINSASTTISNNLVSNNLTSPTTTSTNNIYTNLGSGGEINIGNSLSANYIFGSTEFSSSSTFNVGVSFLGISSFNNGGTFSEIEQTSGSQLVIRNTTNNRKVILSTTSASTGQVDSLVINTTSCDILSPTLNLNSSSTINILTPNNLTGVINFLNTLTTATINFCSTAYTSIFNLNARLAHKGVQYMNEVKTISGTSATLAFPLEQMWMFTSTGGTQITVTLPEITASHQAGFNFIIFKTASNTNSVLFNRSGTNTIRGLNSITDVTSVTRLSGTNSVGVGFYTAEVSAGNFAWISY